MMAALRWGATQGQALGYRRWHTAGQAGGGRSSGGGAGAVVAVWYRQAKGSTQERGGWGGQEEVRWRRRRNVISRDLLTGTRPPTRQGFWSARPVQGAQWTITRRAKTQDAQGNYPAVHRGAIPAPHRSRSPARCRPRRDAVERLTSASPLARLDVPGDPWELQPLPPASGEEHLTARACLYSTVYIYTPVIRLSYGRNRSWTPTGLYKSIRDISLEASFAADARGSCC